MYAICGGLQVGTHTFTLEGAVAKHFFFVRWLFSLLGQAGQGAQGAYGAHSIDVECLAGDVSAGLAGEEDEWTVEGVEGGGG